jgi:hypothetical protein
MNDKRNGLTLSQIAAIAAELPEFESQIGRSSAIHTIARRLGIGKTVLGEALTVKRCSPEEFENIKLGQISCTKAIQKLQAEGKLTKIKRTSKFKGVKRGPSPVKGIKRGHTDKSKQQFKRIEELALQGYTADQIGSELGIQGGRVRILAASQHIPIPGDRATQFRRRRIDVNRVIGGTVDAANNAIVGLEMIEGRTDQIDHTELSNWIGGLNRAIKELIGLKRQLQTLKETADGQQDATESKIAVGSIQFDED